VTYFEQPLCLTHGEPLLTTSAPQALLEMEQLLLQFQKSQGEGVMKRMLHFLNAQGYQQHFEEQEQELRDCLLQLSTILNMAHFTSQVGAAASRGTPSLLMQHQYFGVPTPIIPGCGAMLKSGTARQPMVVVGS
jgi:hypothetical protein